MRPKKERWVSCDTSERFFSPKNKTSTKKEPISLTLDEFEAIRLADHEGLKQEDAAKLMKISRPTFSRVISSAHAKIGDALVNIKPLKIEGGCCKFVRKKRNCV